MSPVRLDERSRSLSSPSISSFKPFITGTPPWVYPNTASRNSRFADGRIQPNAARHAHEQKIAQANTVAVDRADKVRSRNPRKIPSVNPRGTASTIARGTTYTNILGCDKSKRAFMTGGTAKARVAITLAAAENLRARLKASRSSIVHTRVPRITSPAWHKAIVFKKAK